MKTNTNENQKSELKSRPEQRADERKKAGTVYDLVTERIMALLEKGTVPWRKPWKSSALMPMNLLSKRQYTGINTILLHSMNYESPFWLTFRQALAMGANVRRGEKSCPVVFWKKLEIKDSVTGEVEKIPLLRYYSVFNLSQCDGFKEPPVIESKAECTTAEQIIEQMPSRPEIKFHMRAASYARLSDIVSMPRQDSFSKREEYFSTIFHELVHSTGHESRLNRASLNESEGYGTDPYCREELVAEMGASFLCGQAGIVEATIENSAAYLAGWLKALSNDKKLIVHAAAQAQKAADFILGVQHKPNEET